MNKTELIDTLADRTGYSKVVTRGVLETLTHVVTEVLAVGYGTDGCIRHITLPGLGKFHVIAEAERKGRNPSTGAEITIPARRAVKFKASQTLKDAVNG